jgi:ATP-dependent Clp protease ATP-binding subunit ClpC
MRVYFVTHHDKRLTGHLIRKASNWWENPVTAYGRDEEEVLRQLQQIMQLRLDRDEDDLERYLWSEPMATQLVSIAVRPQKALKRRFVIGGAEVPLRLTFAWSELPGGSGYHIILPRFEWWFVLETLEMATDVLRQSVSAALLGERARLLFDFRHEDKEYVIEWRPKLNTRRRRAAWRVNHPSRFPTLHAVAEELVERARKHKISPPVGDLINMTEHNALFMGAPPRSILLVGPTGVGKSTWVRQLARHLLSLKREGHELIPALWSTSAERIIAGMQYLGQWEERCLDMIRELSQEGDYLYVDRLLDIMRVRGDDHSSIADLFAGPLKDREISLIAECDEHEYERCRRLAPTFVECFQIIRVEPPTTGQMPNLMQLYQQRLRPQVVWSAAALRQLVSQLDFFRRDAAFPGKALRLLDWYNQEQAQAEPSKGPLSADLAAGAFSRWSGLPVKLIADGERWPERQIFEELSAAVIGQPDACEQAARVLARLKAGMNDPERPCGALCFVGPTGVGKTELAKALAAKMFGDSSRMIRLDMSEFMMPGSSQRLLWTGRGIKSLAEQVRQQPLSLILLDEIEKAHPEVFDLLLGVLGEGRLTDDSGRLVDLRMSVIIMTSNLGVRAGGGVGFGAEATASGHDFITSVRKHFRPELFNRLDAVVPFAPLTPEALSRIVHLELHKASQRAGLTRRRITLEVTPDARTQLATRGYEPARGARPLKRLIEEQIMTPLAIALSADPSLKDRCALIGWDNDQRRFEMTWRAA